jgi:HEAT repeat protein
MNIMSFLETAFAQVRAWNASAALASENDSDRKRAMHTLRDLGPASLPALHAAARRAGAPRAQFAAAVVLHWLGDTGGLPILTDALCWQLPSAPDLARDLEAGFIAVGAPDAVDALMRAWRQVSPTKDKKDSRRVLKTICRVWAKLGDPRPLTLLVAAADQMPDLFEEIVPTFRDKALPYLQPLCIDPLATRRSVAVRTLRHIEGNAAIDLLVPLLRDSDPGIRALTAQALDKMERRDYAQPSPAYAEILRALRDGYSTPQAVEILARHQPPYDDLLHLVLRWKQAPDSPENDTLDAVLAALPVLARLPLTTPQARMELHLHLCSVLERRPEPKLMAAVASALTLRGRCGEPADEHIRRTLFVLLPHPDAEVRMETALALAALGDPVGRQLLQTLETAWPQGNWRDKLQLLLRDGTDASQVANAAVQWFTRVSKETVGRWGGNPVTRAPEPPSRLDSRLPELLRRMLANALSALVQTSTADQADIAPDLCVACIRALVPLDPQAARSAHPELVLALHLYRPGAARAYAANANGASGVRLHDLAEGVRLAAGQALIALYGGDSFPLFLQCLYAAPVAIRVTAIDFLGELADIRALPHLQTLAAQPDPVLSAAAGEAMTRIRHLHPETMMLLRASSPGDARPDTLLRPVLGNTDPGSADLLLRATEAPRVSKSSHVSHVSQASPPSARRQAKPE